MVFSGGAVLVDVGVSLREFLVCLILVPAPDHGHPVAAILNDVSIGLSVEDSTRLTLTLAQLLHL